jgi:DNA-binding NtrC family response regulator
VDDEEAVLASEARILQSGGIENVISCRDPRDVMSLLARQPVSVVLLDIAMPHISGDRLLTQIREQHPDIPVIIVTASEEIDMAVRCMKSGAHDYMIKAVEPNRLVSGVRRAVEMWELSRRYSELRRRVSEGPRDSQVFSSIITRNRRMESLFLLIEAIAPTGETVLVTGETGTGKELVAEAVHKVSRRKGEIVTVNVAGLDDAMFSDTLFGHRRGAYTGAEEDRAGLVQQARGGTLFLDEIGDLNASSQVKLLRLIERHEYYQLGSDVVRTTDARFVVATNCSLTEMVDEGRFRKDLYYRLQTHEIRIPALRDRKDDLPLLLDHFLDQAAAGLGRKRLAVPPELLTLLETYDFPGNVRELRSMVYNAVSLQKEKMLSTGPFREAMGRAGDHPTPAAATGELVFPDRLPTIREVTERLIEEAMARSKGNQAIAAGLLGITPQALSKRLARRRSGR